MSKFWTHMFVKDGPVLQYDRTTDAGRVRFAQRNQAPLYEVVSLGGNVTLDIHYTYLDAMKHRDECAKRGTNVGVFKDVAGAKMRVA